MRQVEVLGRRDRLDGVLIGLQRARAAEVAATDVAPVTTPADDADRTRPSGMGGPAPETDDLEAVLEELAEVEAGLRRLLDTSPQAEPAAARRFARLLDPVQVQAVLARATMAVERPLADRNGLRDELENLPRTLASLSALLPLVPELALMTDTELATVHLATVVLVLDDPDAAVLGQLREQLSDLLGARHLLVAVRSGPATGCLLVLPASEVAAVEGLLGRDHVERMSLPAQYSGRSLRSTVDEMRQRIEVLPDLLAAAESSLRDGLAPHVDELHDALISVRARRERLIASAAAQLTQRGFALRLWVPVDGMQQVRDALDTADPAAVLEPVRGRRRTGHPPVLVRNLRLLRPFERLVGFLSWPAPGGLDPTGLMAAVLPALFGIMVGDVGYGLLLIGLAVVVRRRWGAVNAVASDIGRILALGGCWAVFFGLLFGEMLGDLGKTAFGMPALWFYRGGPQALTPLLIFVLAVGAVHLVLGLLIGLWLAAREQHLPHLLERGGTLLVFGGLFALAGTAVSVLPGAALPPALAAVVIGIVLAGVAHGPLGVLLGPLEVIGRIGNVLSYLRLAAVGLASVYLAVVANELARQAPLVLGVVVAVFFHALNLALAAFSPMIQALRLHYVEFFGTFHAGGGRAFHPLGAELPLAPPSPPPTRARLEPEPNPAGLVKAADPPRPPVAARLTAPHD